MDRPPTPYEELQNYLERMTKRMRAEGFMLHVALPDDGSINICGGRLRKQRARIAQVLDEHEDQPLPD